MTTIDELGERAAAAARADAAGMAGRRVESGLESLRLGDGPIVAVPRRGIDPRRWLTLGVAAALTAAAIVALAVNANQSADRRVVPGGTSTQVTTASTVGSSSSVASTEVVPNTAATQVVPADAIAVSHNALPPAYPTTVFVTVEAPANPARLPLVAIGDTQIVTVDTDTSTATVIDPFATDVAPQQVPLAVTLAGESIAAGPGDVLYGVSQGTDPLMSIVAVALSGDRVGQVVASAPISAAAFAEAPNGVLGHGADGIIDRRTGQTLLAYVDIAGASTSSGRAAHQVSIAAGDVLNSDVDFLLGDPDGKHQWHMAIHRSADSPFAPDTFQTPAAPSSHGGAVVWTAVGPPSDPTADVAIPTEPVIAVLAADGTGTWYSLADGWQVAASDLDGTMLMRRNGNKVELARVDPPQRIDFLNQPAAPHERVQFAVTLPSTLTSATPCTIDQLDVVPTTEGAMGTTYGVLNVRNKSDQACEVLGVPNVAFLDEAGNIVQSTDPTLLGSTGSATPVVLEKDSWATSLLGAIASNVCGGNESSQVRLTIDAKSVVVPFAVGRPIDPQQCDPSNTQTPGPVLLAAQPFEAVQPTTDAPNPFANLQVTIEAPATVKAGDVLRYDLVVTAPTDTAVLPNDACPIYTETLGAAALGQYLLDCTGTEGILIAPGETVRFHIELPIPADAATGPATLTWIPVEPVGSPVTGTVTITA
ncbi:MAG: hypothetical protein QOJ74_148 [Ilumatobacteraceae bacterium]|nr:hypothetical protein [Ilumatobacteraceae bacterium]